MLRKKRTILIIIFSFLLIFSIFSVESRRNDTSDGEKRFISRFFSFITGLVTFPSQPPKPSPPPDNIDEKNPSINFNYFWHNGTWSSCNASCQQSRTVLCKRSDGTTVNDSFCTTPKPASVQGCTGGQCRTCTDSKWECSNWSSCINGKRERNCTSNCGNTKAENESCTIVQECTSFSYSSWSQCNSSGQRTRIITMRFPENCQGGNPKLVEDCLCTEENWVVESIVPSECPISRKQNRSWKKIGNCTGGIQKPQIEEIACNYISRCSDECSLGNKSCFQGGYKECINNTRTGCTVWGNLIPCPTRDYYCVNGSCVLNDSLMSFDENIQDLIQNSSANTPLRGEYINGTNIIIGQGSVEITQDNKKIAKFFTRDGSIKSFSDSKVKISKGKIQNRNFLIIKNENEDYNRKEVYLEIRESSLGVCVKDEEIENVVDLLTNCVFVRCPGREENFSCSIHNRSNSSYKTVLVSGLRHSGIIEVFQQENTNNNPSQTTSSVTNLGEKNTLNNEQRVEENETTLKENNWTQNQTENQEIVQRPIHNLTKNENSSEEKDYTLWIIIGASIFGLILIIIFIVAASKGKKKEDNFNQIIQQPTFPNISQSPFQKNPQTQTFEKPPELPINPVLKQVNQILDECTATYLSKNYEKAKELYDKAKEIYEKNGLNDGKTKKRFLSLFEGLRRV